MSDILAYVEQRNGQVKKAGLEALSAARAIAKASGGKVTALLAGSGIGPLAAILGEHGAERVLVADAPELEPYATGAHARAVEEAVTRSGARIVLMGATSLGKDLAPAAAARLRAGMASDCVGLSLDGGRLLARRPVFSGKAFATVRILSEIQVATTRPNAFRAEKAAAKPAIETLAVALSPADLAARTREIRMASGAKQDLNEAETVVSGGRGLKGPENFHLVEKLAEALGGAVGASRAIVDAGWRPHAEQVGQTGKTVSPTLYVAVGISGAIQHLAGMSSAKVIVAINPDKEAPIFKVATYGLVGDALQVIPPLIEEIKKAKER